MKLSTRHGVEEGQRVRVENAENSEPSHGRDRFLVRSRAPLLLRSEPALGRRSVGSVDVGGADFEAVRARVKLLRAER